MQSTLQYTRQSPSSTNAKRGRDARPQSLTNPPHHHQALQPRKPAKIPPRAFDTRVRPQLPHAASKRAETKIKSGNRFIHTHPTPSSPPRDISNTPLNTSHPHSLQWTTQPPSRPPASQFPPTASPTPHPQTRNPPRRPPHPP